MVYATCLLIPGNPAEAEGTAQECYEALVREKGAARVRVVGALKLEGDEAIGAKIVQNVKAKKGNVGYNAETGEYEDLIKADIPEPEKMPAGGGGGMGGMGGGMDGMY